VAGTAVNLGRGETKREVEVFKGLHGPGLKSKRGGKQTGTKPSRNLLEEQTSENQKCLRSLGGNGKSGLKLESGREGLSGRGEKRALKEQGD